VKLDYSDPFIVESQAEDCYKGAGRRNLPKEERIPITYYYHLVLAWDLGIGARSVRDHFSLIDQPYRP